MFNLIMLVMLSYPFLIWHDSHTYRPTHTYDGEFDVHFYNLCIDGVTSELFYSEKELFNRLKTFLLCDVEKEVPAAVVLGDITKSPAVE